jgi:hypothetical protein
MALRHVSRSGYAAGGGSSLTERVDPRAALPPDTSRWHLRAADTARPEGVHTTFRAMVLVMGRPREVVLRRVPRSVRADEVPVGCPNPSLLSAL